MCIRDRGTAVWSHGETIYIRVERKDIASIYSVAGQLVRRIELSEGDTSVPMQRGVYVVTLKDGTVHKVIVK
ncbi:T9SS type A sorting domain-containing protein [Tannerella forsythia]|uniref:T9SS type A sorting domain-containing protein n=1 Tax=Tannerella forsythia TaxID=28112 RepID=UPI00111DE00C|nr:T9SS type A sorting domain-containing protein [Tannerella forsythia]TPE17319.1 T9SS type A sorting domain-containing protein [Tannerella forsythia]